MKKRFINRLAAFILFAMMGANLFSQGFYVYTKDGKRQDYASENVDSIVFYEKAAGDIVGNFINGHEYVDLGLPSGLKWATCNVGASKPEEYGGYYAWGETEEKDYYRSDTYKYWDLASSTGYVDIGSNISSTQYDVAYVKWGGSWRMPTESEIQELVNNCTREWTTYNGVKGQLVTGFNGNSIFLPAAGYRSNRTTPINRGSFGFYWGATLYKGSSDLGYYHSFSDGNSSWGGFNRIYGLSVRPVTE